MQVFFVSCDNEEKYFDESIIGKWDRVYSISGENIIHLIYLLNEDGSGLSYFELETNNKRFILSNENFQPNRFNYYLIRSGNFNEFYRSILPDTLSYIDPVVIVKVIVINPVLYMNPIAKLTSDSLILNFGEDAMKFQKSY
jgi:hypothetical protein